MVDIRIRLQAEMQNIETVLAQLPGADKLTAISALELAGVAALLHSFYNGIENVLKQVAIEKSLPISDGATWHRDLLNAAVSARILSMETKNALVDYLAFRHFFSHGYAMDLEPDRLEPLVTNVSRVYSDFKKDLKRALPLDG
jgi:hypothetical protein